jgi:hypothetical protein
LAEALCNQTIAKGLEPVASHLLATI